MCISFWAEISQNVIQALIIEHKLNSKTYQIPLDEQEILKLAAYLLGNRKNQNLRAERYLFLMSNSWGRQPEF